MKKSTRFLSVLLSVISCVFIVYYIAGAGTLSFDGVPVDITTTTGEDLVITPGTGGNTQIGDASGTNTNATANDDIHVTGKIEADGVIYADAGITSGGGIASNTDSTDSLGTTSKAWANLYVDAIQTTAGTILDIVKDKANVNQVADVLSLSRTTSGTPVANIGAGLVFKVEDAGGTEEQGSIDVQLSTVTDAAEDADMIFSVNKSGTIQEMARIDSSAGMLHVGAGGADGKLRLYSEQGSTDYSVTFQPHTTMTEVTTYTLPAADGSADQVLSTSGTGALSWATVSSDSIGDADGDTKIQVEESADEDIIRFDTAGSEVMQIGASGGVLIGDGDAPDALPGLILHAESPSADDKIFTITTTASDTEKFSVDEDGDVRGGIYRSYALLNESAASTNPVFTIADDPDTGVGSATLDQLSLIVGGLEGIHLEETAGSVIVNINGSTRDADNNTGGDTWTGLAGFPTGTSTGKLGGGITITGGAGDGAAGQTAANGGDLKLVGGAAASDLASSDGGNVYIYGGANGTSGNDGNVILAYDTSSAIGNVGIGEATPGTLLDIAGTAPYITLHNTTEEDGEAGREGKIIFEGEQSGTEQTTLAVIQASHDGAADDQKGDLIFYTNDGDDGDTPTEQMRIASDGTVTFAGTISGGGAGDVTGPGSSTDNAITRFDSTTGKLLQNSGVTIDDSNNVTGVADLTATGNVTIGSGASPILQVGHYGTIRTTYNAGTLTLSGANSTANGSQLKLYGYAGSATTGQWGLLGAVPSSDWAPNDCLLTGNSAKAAASTNLDGGAIDIDAGAGASASAGDADGGNVTIDGGANYGTGSAGNVVLAGTRGLVGIGEIAPATLLEMTSTAPYITLHNNTDEDTEGGRESQILFKGEQSGAEETTLAKIQASHDGTADDQKGDLIFYTNDGSDGDTPTEQMRIASDGTVTFAGTISGGGAGDVSAAASLTDNAIVRGDGGSKGVQTSSVLIDDSNNVSGMASLITGNTTIGTGGAGVDYTLTFNGEDDDCVLTYDEDNNLLNAGDTAFTFNGTAKVNSDGEFSCNLASSGTGNECYGDSAGDALTTGGYGVYIGRLAGSGTDAGGNNVMIGNAAGLSNTGGDENVYVGASAGQVAQGNNNICIGADCANNLSSGSNNLMIGYDIDAPSATASNQMSIGNLIFSEGIDGTGTTVSSGNLGIAEPAPATLLEMTGTAPYITLHNNTDEDTDGGRESQILFKGQQTGAEETTLAKIQASHDGTSDDQKGDLIFYTNDGDDADTPTEQMRIASDGTVTFAGTISGGGAGDVTAGASLTDNAIVRGDGGSKGVQTSSLLIDDSDNMTGVGNLTTTALEIAQSSFDSMSWACSSATGVENSPLILINDDRTGTTSDEVGEAALVIDAEGTYSLYIQDGILWSSEPVYFNNDVYLYGDGKEWKIGAGSDMEVSWDTNGDGDDLATLRINKGAATDTSCIFISKDRNPFGMTDHDDYLSPTFVFVNDETADNNDYAGVVMGETTESDVTTTHYFDFYAMTGATDGSADATATEVGATFRFGNGQTAATSATGAGDVVFNDNVEIDGTLYIDGSISGGGVGDASGPASSTDNAIARFDGAGGKTLQNSGVTIDDSNNVSGVVDITITGDLNLSSSAPTIAFSGDVGTKTILGGGTANAIDIGPGNLTSNGGRFFLYGNKHATQEGGYNLIGNTAGNDDTPGNCTITGVNAKADASTNLDGGAIDIDAGGGASSSAGDADGGNVTIDGGIGYGTGDDGNVVLAGTRGLVGIGETTPLSMLEVRNSDATANAIVDVLTITKDTSGTAANNIGAGISIQVEDAGGSEEQASIDVVVVDTTDLGEDADMVFSLNSAGAITEIMRLNAQGTSVELPEVTAPSGNPASNKGWLYVKDNSGTSDLYFEDDGGTVTELTAGGGGGADTALSNLASVAINDSLISDTDSTDDLGSSSKAWANLYVDNIQAVSTTDVTIKSANASGDLAIQMNNDTDDYIQVSAVSNVPCIYGKGAYVSIGDAATTSNSLDAEDDLLVTGDGEVDGVLYVDGAGDSDFGGDVTVDQGNKFLLDDDDGTADTYITFDTTNNWIEFWVDGNEGVRIHNDGQISSDVASEITSAEDGSDIFDEYDDVELLKSYVYGRYDELPTSIYKDGFVNQRNLKQLISGAIFQMDDRLKRIEEALRISKLER